MDLDTLLNKPLSPDETRWAMELADKLPDDVDISFEEARMLARLPIDQWPAGLLDKVRDVIDFRDFLDDADEQPMPEQATGQ